jgi:hypothetical protein
MAVAQSLRRFAAPNYFWQWLLAINSAILAALFLYKLLFHFPGIEYAHLLVDYHFGFIRRALIGSAIGLFTDRVPVTLVFALGLAVWLAALALFVMLHQRTFGRISETLPLFVFVFGSPFFLKNFMFSIGYLDIYGFVVAAALLLIPVNRLYVPLAVAACMILQLVHHLHLLLYVPTIAAIVIVRGYLLPGVTSTGVMVGVAGALAVAAVFAVVQFGGAPQVPADVFLQYLSSRATAPLDNEKAWMWYSTLAGEIQATWRSFPRHAARFPVYAVFVLLHYPLLRFFASMIRAVPNRFHRATVIAALACITVGYVIIFAVVFDYARFVSNWFTCMILMLYATTLLAPRGTTSVPSIDGQDRNTRLAAVAVTAVPKVGITIPF